MSYGHMAIFCKDCGGMFYASSLDPAVIFADAKQINEYIAEGHKMKCMPVVEIREMFGEKNCETCSRED